MKHLSQSSWAIAAALFGLVVGCASADAPLTDTGQPASDSPATDSQITTYDQLASQLTSAADNYHAAMMGDVNSVADCQAIHDQYDAQVRPWVSQMMDLSDNMDDFMVEHGSQTADAACVAEKTMAELDHHNAIACTLDNLDLDKQEAIRHVDAVDSFSQRAEDRCTEMFGAMDGDNEDWAPMFQGCEDYQSTENTECSDYGMMHHMMGANCE